MSRQYTDHTDGLEYHRRSNQTRETAAEYALRASPRTCPISRTSPQQDTDSDKGDQQPRRRIGLAVRADTVLARLSAVCTIEAYTMDS